jgi:hypothetical protein
MTAYKETGISFVTFCACRSEEIGTQIGEDCDDLLKYKGSDLPGWIGHLFCDPGIYVGQTDAIAGCREDRIHVGTGPFCRLHDLGGSDASGRPGTSLKTRRCDESSQVNLTYNQS